MVMVSKFSNFPDELSENDESRQHELRGSAFAAVIQYTQISTCDRLISRIR